MTSGNVMLLDIYLRSAEKLNMEKWIKHFLS